MSFVAPLVRPILGKALRYVYTGLRQQDRIIDYTYRKTGLYNRGVVRGIKHGLAGGQIIGGSLKLGLNPIEDTQVSAPVQKKQRFRSTTRKPYKTRFRCPSRNDSRNSTYR